jgi:NADPH:quinone reductase
MKAVVCQEYGAPEDLVFTEIPDPVPGPGQLVVWVVAAAVNFPDVLFISGGYQVTVPPPFAPGSEFAGEVLALGEGVTSFRVGDRVAGSTMVGAFAEQVVVADGSVTPIPDGVDFADAAAFGVTYRTAYHCLRSVAEIRSDDWVVVLGAAGGVGLAAVDLAVAMKAKVIAAASSPEKLELCLQRGATAAVDYDREKLRDRIRDITGAGADAVLDPVGGPYSEPALRGLGRGGRFITLGYAAGSIPSIPLNLVLLKGITLQGMEIRTFMGDHPQEAERDMRELADMLASGTVRPHIGARFPLRDAAVALRHVADRKALGKVIIEVA